MKSFRHSCIIALSVAAALTGLNSCKKEFSPDLPFPDVYSQTLFVGSNNQIVYAIDPVSGLRKWRFSVDSSIYATPVLHANALWVATTKGTLYKLNQQYGTETKQRLFPDGITGTPYGYNNSLLLVPSGTKLYAINTDNMEDVWTYDIGGKIEVSPTSHTVAKIDNVNEPVIFIAGGNNRVVALNKDGGELWNYQPKDEGAFYSSPCVINDSFLYIGNDNGNMYALYTYNGSEKWSFPTSGQIRSSPIQIGGNVLFGSNDRNFYSVDSATGKMRWKIQTADVVQSSPSVYNQNVYFGSYDKNLYCVDILDGKIKWKMLTFALVKASPVVYRGNVYFGSFDKNLYCLDANDGSQQFVFNINGQMATSPIIDSVGGAAVPSINGNYRY